MNFDEKAMWNRLSDAAGNYYTQADDLERESMRAFVKGLLHQGSVLVEFVKADGAVRAMNCTLSEQHGAQHKITEAVETVNNTVESKPEKVNDQVCRIWDIDQAAWRSFRWDRLKRIEFKIG
jgi:S-adenosylhomocysteine hydrolase